MAKRYSSHGTGAFTPDQFASLGENVIFEPGALVFHPENIHLGSNVYVGHYAILKGYYRNRMVIGDNVWIGQQCFFHAAGGLTIGDNVGIGPGVRILTAAHLDRGPEEPLSQTELIARPVTIEEGCNIGIGAIILPGVTIGQGAQVGAGAVVTRDVPPYTVVVGNPARPLRRR